MEFVMGPRAYRVGKLIAVLALMMVASAAYAAEQVNVCLDCHAGMDGALKVTPESYGQDVHVQKGLTCTSCHGGDDKDADKAMTKQAGFKGHIDRKKVPEICASCHADASFMKQYNPSLRTDQLAQYKTSVHGKKLASGDTNVAVCTDCHGLHGIRPANDTRSKVHPLHIAGTCSACHSDRDKMKPYNIKTDQFAAWSMSVHQEAIAVRGDLSAPTCTTCHGNHGAAPPGVASVENVCSTCHVFQAQLFDKSPHKAAFAGSGGCITCHSNHRITHPTDAMIGTGKESVCTNCHTAGDAGLAAAARIQQDLKTLDTAIKRSDELLDRASRSGMEVSEANLQQNEARDALTKARVTLHAFKVDQVQWDLVAGVKITEKTYQAGIQSLKERDYRRMGLGVSLFTILAVLVGLKMFIKDYEGRH
jgi:Cytochrome c3/Cytochrome c554 and c-prime